MPQPKQTYQNHVRFVPLFHYVVLPIVFANVIWTAWRVIETPRGEQIMGLLVAIALLLTAFFARVFALKAQDRVIRLEMRLRLNELLPADLKPKIGSLSTSQLVALRFASDAELPGLVAKVLEDDIKVQKTIKTMIKDWQGDYTRV